MKYIMIFFLVIALIILVAGHAGLYYSWVWLFEISAVSIKQLLAICLGVLSLSFVVSALLVHFVENGFTEKLYIAASVWLGYAWYAALATVFAMLITWAMSSMGLQNTGVWTISVLLFVAAIYTGYGMWNAQHIRVNNVTVTVPNLPDAWEGKRIAHLSDIHLGVFHKNTFMQEVARLTNEQNPDIVFVTGDLFDGAGKMLSHLVDPLDEIDVPLGRFFITGNHETYIDLQSALDAVVTTHTKVLRDELVEIDGLQILGIDYPGPGEKKNYEEVFQQLDKNSASVILFHEPRLEVIALAKQYGGSLMLAGHTHEGQLWPFGYITRGIYKRFHQGFQHDGDLSVYTSSGVGTWGPPMRTGTNAEIVMLTLTKK